MNKESILLEDLERIESDCGNVLESLRNKKIFLTGGTGFIGRWFLNFISHLNKKNFNIYVKILTRDIEKFKKNYKDIYLSKNFVFQSGDVLNFIEDNSEVFDYVIHGATDASAYITENFPIRMFDTIVMGTRNILDFAIRVKTKKFLHLSSGAIYGNQPFDVKHIPESYLGGPVTTDPKATYAEGKRASEMLCAIYSKTYGIHFSIARIFAILGPMLSLDIHFAAGNFIRDALSNKKIIIEGNGKPIRSYIYPSDLISALVLILTNGKSGAAYNVGSEESLSIYELANLISKVLQSDAGVEVKNYDDKGWNIGRYVPSTSLIEKELNFKRNIDIETAILRTGIWNGWKN